MAMKTSIICTFAKINTNGKDNNMRYPSVFNYLVADISRNFFVNVADRWILKTQKWPEWRKLNNFVFIVLARKQEVIKMTEQLVDSINTGDYEAYT